LWLARRSVRIAAARFWARVRCLRGIIAVLSPHRSSGRGATVLGPVGTDKDGKISAPTVVGDVFLPIRRGPDDGAIDELLVMPAPERLQ